MAMIHVCDNCGTQLKTWQNDQSRIFETLHPEHENTRMRITIRVDVALEQPLGDWDSVELCALCMWKWLHDTIDDIKDTTPIADEIEPTKLVTG